MKRNLYLLLYLTLIGTKINYVQSIDSTRNSTWEVIYENSTVTVDMNNAINSSFQIAIFDNSLRNSKVDFYCETSHICACNHDPIKISDNRLYYGNITVTGLFLGKSKLCSKLILQNESSWISDDCQNVIVLKEFGIADQIFTISIAIVVSIIFISFGACLEIDSLKEILIKPVGPVIGFCCQFILMPVISYIIGYILFWDDVNMWLGLFFSGVSPGGGASNMWTLILKGNVNLSIVMTTISNLAAFAMMPLWIFSLGATIFNRGNLGVPYERIAIFSVSLIIPLVIGILLKKFQPKIANILIRLLKPITIIILIYIMTFAIIINFYVFKLFTWKIILAGMGLPWFGYILSYLISWILKQNKKDCLTISIETGLQNTGIAMFLLRFSLEQPEADLTSVIPVAVGFMTLIPLLTLYLLQKFFCSKVAEIEDISSHPDEEQRIMSPPSTRNELNLQNNILVQS